MKFLEVTHIILILCILTHSFHSSHNIHSHLLEDTDEMGGEGDRNGNRIWDGVIGLVVERVRMGMVGGQIGRIASGADGGMEGGQGERVLEEMLRYSGKFRKLEFGLDERELRQLAYDVRDLYEKDKTALFFISAYFIRACQLLQKRKTPALEITKIIKRKIKELMNMCSIETYRKQKYGPSSTNGGTDMEYWRDIEEVIVPMTPKKFKIHPENKDNQIQDIILGMVSEAEEKLNIFKQLSETICEQNGGLTHHINFKIKNKSQKSQMKRVKQKLLRNYFKPHSQRCLNTFLNIGWKRKIQQSGFQHLLSKVYQDLTELEFLVKDILRSKCMFRSVPQIHSAALSLISMVSSFQRQGHNIKIVEFENRLKNITCDVMLIVQIDGLPCQIQLALDFDENLFEISHKMYEMSRSKVFSPIVLLFDWFQKIAPQFLYKIGTLLQKQIENGPKIGPDKLTRQYSLLNQFFHLTSYLDIDHLSEKEFEQETEYEISKVKEEIIEPFTKIDNYL